MEEKEIQSFFFFSEKQDRFIQALSQSNDQQPCVRFSVCDTTKLKD